MKKTVLFAALALAFAAFAAPALAVDIDISTGVGVTGIVQTGISSALSDMDSSADVAQIAGLASVSGNFVNDVTTNVVATAIAQSGTSTAWVPPGAPSTAVVDATVTQVAGLANVLLHDADSYGNIDTSVLASNILQGAVSTTIGTAIATSDVSQLAGVAVVSVNVGP